MIEHQERKVLELARLRNPHVTLDDLLNPHDFGHLAADPIFQYEDGITCGLRTAHAALRRELSNGV